MGINTLCQLCLEIETLIDLYFLIPAVNAQIFNPTTELAIPTRTPTNDANAEIEIQPLTAETKTRKCSK